MKYEQKADRYDVANYDEPEIRRLAAAHLRYLQHAAERAARHYRNKTQRRQAASQ